MKFIFRLFILSLLFICCSSNNYKERLIGNWAIVYGANEFEFYQDSMVVRSMGLNYVNLWEMDESKLYLAVKKEYEYMELKDIILDYGLSDNHDTLFLKSDPNDSYGVPILRINSAFDLLIKQLLIDIDLNKKDDIFKNRNDFSIDIFVGYTDDKLIATYYTDKIKNLDDIRSETNYRRATFEVDQNISDCQFNLIIDKKVKQVQIDSIKSILKTTGITKMFRIYNNNEIDYTKTDWLSEFDWYGVYED